MWNAEVLRKTPDKTKQALPSKSLCSGFQDTEVDSSLFYDLPIKISQTKALKVGVGGLLKSLRQMPIYEQEVIPPPFLRGSLWFEATWKPICINDPCTSGVQLACHCGCTPNTRMGLHRHAKTLCFSSAIWQLFIHKIFNQTYFPLSADSLTSSLFLLESSHKKTADLTCLLWKWFRILNLLQCL